MTYLPSAKLADLPEDAPAHADADGIDLVLVEYRSMRPERRVTSTYDRHLDSVQALHLKLGRWSTASASAPAASRSG